MRLLPLFGLLSLLILVVACSTAAEYRITPMDADNMARSAITSSPLYSEHGGHSLQIIAVKHKSCPGCFGFEYQYNINPDTNDQNASNVHVIVTLKNNNIVNFIEQLIRNNHSIQSFEECVSAGHPVMESHPRQCRAQGQLFVEHITYSKPNNAGFCGSSTKASCETSDDCMVGGCSGQVCQGKFEEPVITTCEFKHCYQAPAYGLGCGCINNVCQWG